MVPKEATRKIVKYFAAPTNQSDFRYATAFATIQES